MQQQMDDNIKDSVSTSNVVGHVFAAQPDHTKS